ncbi:MAG TPA: CDP-alcohol phosphatidyltransferase family protein [Stellaceae bacterium]|nr:CDP-alcohol phosphatidyltransferase family protein [Stellaceae bacterium]
MNLPNLITLGRLLLVPLAIWLILAGDFAAAFWTFVVAGVSDAADGFIAKKFGMTTELGALLDPVADKVLLVSVYATLGIAGQLPAWLVILVIFRDLMIVGGFLFIQLLFRKLRWEPLVISKINTALQIVLAAFTLARLGLGIADRGVGEALILAAAGTTVLSGAAYLVRWTRSIAGAEGTG